MKNIFKQELKLLFALLSALPIRNSPNAQYKKRSVFRPLVRAAVQNTSIENACKWAGSISADTVFYRFGNLSLKGVREWIETALDRLVRRAKKKYRLTNGVTVAIDYTKIPYYGEEETPWTIISRHEKGTNTFLVVINMHIVMKGQRFTIAVLPVSRFDTSANLLERLILIAKRHFRIKCVLLDRYFESIDCINMLKGHVRFIMPKKRNIRTVRFMKNMYLQRTERTVFTIRQDNKTASFDMVILETKDDLVGYITNTSGTASHIGELYKTRWGIETGYSVKNEFHAVTCSNNFAIRYLMVFVSFIIYDLWALVNVKWHKLGIYRITAKDVCVCIGWSLDSGIS